MNRIQKNKRAYIGLGSNLNNPRQQLITAIADIKKLPDSHVVSVSNLYETAPVGYHDQPNFINAVLALDTQIPAEQLLQQLQHIENEHGRIRNHIRFGPRTLDLDLLLYDWDVFNTDQLKVPHPRMLEREFVLKPLAEIAPNFPAILAFVKQAIS